ncbi:MAG TPA: putative glycolipid-binding domain-containing protein [Terriglobales bacterium]|nr:putative glycolipid-binding domain-containing protein [Terriglobales bacterium]
MDYAPPAEELLRTVVWRNLFLNGTELCHLSRISDGWLLKGTVVGAVDEHHPLHADYAVYCDSQWRTRRVEVNRTIAANSQSLRLSVGSDGVWRSPDGELPDVKDCVDIDLGLTPATNTLPIRRLNLSIGQTVSVTAAWAKFPELQIRPLPQTYTRIAANRYRYESATGFSAEIVVDDVALVALYPQGWERIASA